MITAPPSFSEVLSDAMERRGLPLARIRYHLRRRGHDVSVATLSYWRRGVSRPTRGTSLAAVADLEDILDLPVGALAGTLIERLPPVSEQGLSLDELAESLGMSWDDGLVRTATQNIVYVDEHGRPAGHQVRETVVAQRPGISRYPFALWSDDPEARMSVVPSDNCWIGREVRSGSTLVAEVCFPRELPMGGRWMTQLDVAARVDWAEVGQWGWWITARMAVLHCAVMFSPQMVPRRAESIIAVKGTTTVHPMVVRGSVLELHLQDVGPGTVDLRWTW